MHRQGDNATTTTATTNAASNTNTATPEQQPTPTGERGDASCNGFWTRGRDCIFGVRITDTNCRSQRNKKVDKIPATHGRQRRTNTFEVAMKCGRFTPLVYSVDGIAG
ncbi:hypothetical protein ACHAXR_001819 [Thalassiosira sp. AJA248-18]